MNQPIRKIIHIDMDAFFASVELRDRPDLRDVPVVVAWEGARSVVCAASYPARKFGLRSAMPLSVAKRLCPHVVCLPPHFEKYQQASRHIHRIFSRHTDLIEPLSLDEAYLDVSACQARNGSATWIAAEIRQTIFNELNLGVRNRLVFINCGKQRVHSDASYMYIIYFSMFYFYDLCVCVCVCVCVLCM